ncbi:MAG: hypothetical protein AAB706_01345 [Patescibacteria group bacterium]
MQNNTTLLVIVIILGLALYGLGSGNNNQEKGPDALAWYTGQVKQGKTATENDIERDLNDIENRVNTLKEEVGTFVDTETKSPYNGIVSIVNAQDFGSSDPKREYITLYVSGNYTGKITITGWKLQSDTTKKSVNIPSGAAVYYPNIATPNEPVMLSPGDTAIISSGPSPVGFNFKTNKCTGYLGQFNNFLPYLRNECPNPKDENLNFVPQTPINFTCLDYIEALSRCQINTKPLPSNFTPECHAFIAEKINYQGCLSLHKNDKDFYGNEWRIYLGRGESLWLNRRETVQLIDENGKIVSTYVRN